MNLKSIAIGLAIVAGAGVAIYGTWEGTRSMGRSSILKIAQEQKLCESEQCTEGVQVVTAFATEKYNLSPEDGVSV